MVLGKQINKYLLTLIVILLNSILSQTYDSMVLIYKYSVKSFWAKKTTSQMIKKKLIFEN